MSDTGNVPPSPGDEDDTKRIATGTVEGVDGRPWYQKKRVLLPITAVLAFLIGLGVGGDGEDSREERAAEVGDLEEQVAGVEEQLDELGTQVSDIQKTVEAPEAEQAERVEQLEGEVASLQKQVAALKEERDALDARRAEQGQRIQQLESQLASAQQSPSAGGAGGGSSPSQGGSASAQYANCSEARAAGAAPLRRGEPGYDSSLDGDNDGVACE